MIQRLFPLCLVFSLIACDGDDGETPQERTFRMGFQNLAPRPEINLALQALGIWTQRADAAIINTEVPWAELLSGVSAKKYVTDNYNDLVAYYRSKNLKLWVYIDPANGLNRATDANALVSRGKSIADDDMQKVYKRFVIVMDSMLKPEHLGLALETNMIRLLSPASIYQGVKKATNEVAAELKTKGTLAKISVSVQAETAWGKFTNQSYIGIAQDITDFSFTQELGISSYPYFFIKTPSDIPHDYYSRIMEGLSLPCFVSEGGWPSQSLKDASNNTIVSGKEMQREYIQRQELLLNHAKAIGWFQLTFTDIDLAAFPPGFDPSIQYFIYLGLVDINLQSQPSLTAWDEVFKKTFKE